MAAARAVGGSTSARSREATPPASKARALAAVTAGAQGAARDALDYVEKQLAMEH